jgi:excisionase family DNA binding protein
MTSDYESPIEELLTTGGAAQVLGTSRQHVVDLCKRGLLPFSSTGAHRRVRLEDVQQLRDGSGLANDQLRSLWLHQAVARRLVIDPERTVRRARRTLERVMKNHPRGQAPRWLGEWRRVLDGPLDGVVEALTARSERGRELRQNSPFAGVLSESERGRVLASLRRYGA